MGSDDGNVEVKAFLVCDGNADGALTCEEVEECEVRPLFLTKNIKKIHVKTFHCFRTTSMKLFPLIVQLKRISTTMMKMMMELSPGKNIPLNFMSKMKLWLEIL